MGSRASHNLKRRQKLILKHTGREYAPRGRKGKAGQNEWGSETPKKWSRQDTSAQWPDTKKSHQLEGAQRLQKRKWQKKTPVKRSNALSEEAPGRTKTKFKVKKVTKAKGARSTVPEVGKPKIKSDSAKAQVKMKKQRIGSITKAKSKKGNNSADTSETKIKRVSKKALRRERMRERMKLRHRAHVICPGSVTDRFARGKLNGNERRLLLSGGISWRWLREPREDNEPNHLSKKPVVEANSESHSSELWSRQRSIWQRSLNPKASETLAFLDNCLEIDAFWPPCVERVALAARLQTKIGINRRCTRYFDEVIAPLLAEPSRGQTVSGENRSGTGESLMVEARSLCIRCVNLWESQSEKQHSGIGELRVAWLRMLRRALVQTAPGTQETLHLTWLRALRVAILSRLCPMPDGASQERLLRNAAAAAITAASPEQPESKLMMIPLGVFTFWQAVFLVVVAQLLGTTATVVRRNADGTPQVIFRSADVTR